MPCSLLVQAHEVLAGRERLAQGLIGRRFRIPKDNTINRDWDAAVALTTPDVELVNVATGQTFQGPGGVRQFLQGWATAFPDSQVETTAAVADDTTGVIEFQGRGTQTGPLQSPAGDIPPTGKTVDVPFAQMLEPQDGKIRRARLYFDSMTLLQQLGVVPPAS